MAGGQQPQENDVPVYLFTGFLEAGKTKFIQETLEDKRFNSGEKTMLLLCEEGEEEYDISAMPCQDIYIRTIEEPEELNPAHLEELLKECGATRVCWNTMVCGSSSSCSRISRTTGRYTRKCSLRMRPHSYSITPICVVW